MKQSENGYLLEDEHHVHQSGRANMFVMSSKK